MQGEEGACPLPFRFAFFGYELGLGAGIATRLAKAPAGISAFISEIKRVSAKGGGRPAAPPGPMERPAPRGFAKRGAIPAPLRGPRSRGTPYVLSKVKMGKESGGVGERIKYHLDP